MDENDNIVRLAEFQEELCSAAEASLASVYAERHAHEARYVAAWGRWMHYDGLRWDVDDTLHAFDRARAICREVAMEWSNTKRGAKIAIALASARTVAAVERLAKADRRLAAITGQWDMCPWLLQDTSKTIDLRTGIGRDPDPTDYITKRIAYTAAPNDTPHPLWTAFLNRITAKNVELQAFLQRYCGYATTGITSEHKFVFAYGTGANGKSTFVNTIAAIFGDYATIADMGTFIATNNERHPTDLAKLRGARLVVAQETQKGRRWDETKIKALTGGDKITARFMRQDFFDFDPTFKLFITGNHKPRLHTVDEAMRRRLLLVPFTVQIPPAERDPHLLHKLEAERPAILRWCIDGCLEWQRIGLAPPAIVQEATSAYFADQDVLQQWLDECTQDAPPSAFVRTGQLFACWKSWCEERNYAPGTSMALSEALVDRGYEKKRDNHGQRGFRALAIKQQ
jgi:putative DNA primase/helicase